ADTELEGWSVAVYFGGEGFEFETVPLQGALEDQQNGYGTIVVEAPEGAWEGPADALALIDAEGRVVQFVSVEGPFTALDSPAVEMTSQGLQASSLIGSEGASLQLEGIGLAFEDFEFGALKKASFGEVNELQVFHHPDPPWLPACFRRSRLSLSPLAEAVLSAIESTPGALAHSPTHPNRLLSFCNRFDGLSVEGPEIYTTARDLIAGAEHEVDLAFYRWEHDSQAADLIGEGLILAQGGFTPAQPLIVRFLVDDVEDFFTGRTIDELWDSQKRWEAAGLDPTLVDLQFATAGRGSFSANLHDKLIVVDAHHLLVTGANPQPVHDGPDPWHDTAYTLSGAAGLAGLSAFEQTWNASGTYFWECRDRFGYDCTKRSRFPTPSRTWIPATPPAVGDAPVLAVGRKKEGSFLSHPNAVNSPQDLAWLTALGQARSHVHIETPNINDDHFL
ncbi:MAG: phosphatidylserine/phosphatidylglycerophosphate/cardiolipin synthase family protein, partial [Acidobacteria bacterium]|nr:phosphatidylserine/phosphatidylglycerophosphate/cardiolipin synthase family protein [Acidobacteriota bacterium]